MATVVQEWMVKTMTDYIKREDAIYCVKSMLNAISAEDVAPVRHGRWKKDYLCSTNGGTYSVIRCSECDFQFPITVTNYCPNCGAKMDGDAND